MFPFSLSLLALLMRSSPGPTILGCYADLKYNLRQNRQNAVSLFYGEPTNLLFFSPKVWKVLIATFSASSLALCTVIIVILLIILEIIVHILRNARFVLHIKCASSLEWMNRWDILLFIMLFILIIVQVSRDARFVLHIKSTSLVEWMNWSDKITLCYQICY